MKRTLISTIFFLVLLAGRAACEDAVLLTASADALREGIAVSLDGSPAFVRAPETMALVPGMTVELEANGLKKRRVSVTVLEPTARRDQVVTLPVQIEDKSLARGVKLHLITPDGDSTTYDIPPKRVFLSIPFTLPITGDVHSSFAESNRHLIIQVVPRITKKAKVDIDNTATDGLVADIRYEGIAYLKFKDLLNRTNRRDMDGTFFFGRERADRWEIITENLFEKFDDRTVGVMKNEKLGGSLSSQWRLDNLHDFHETSFGLNMIHYEDKVYAKLGNIDRIVKQKVHTELGYGDDNLMALTRFEGIELKNPGGASPIRLKLDRFGYQFRFSGGEGDLYYRGLLGNLKVQDFNDRGEIDDYFNFDVGVSTLLGRGHGAGWAEKKLSFAGEVSLNFWGRGSSSWLEGDLDMNLGYGNEYLVYLRFNNDFARITGDAPNPLWEDIFISFMRNRNYFNPKDRLGRLGLESVFLDLNYSREGKGEPYTSRTRLGISKFMRVWRYDLPVEFYIEKGSNKGYIPGIALSIRRYF